MRREFYRYLDIDLTSLNAKEVERLNRGNPKIMWPFAGRQDLRAPLWSFQLAYNNQEGQ